MKKGIDLAVQLLQAGKRSYERKWSFLSVFAVVFLVSIVGLGWLGLLPSTKSDLVLGLPEASQKNATFAAVSVPNVILSANTPKTIAVAPALPMKIEIPAINLSTIIENPVETDIVTLDKELLKGAVRYPTSARLGEVGNVVLFGHSSYLPVVRNQAYKAFNNIQKLVAGDLVTVYSSDTAYTYQVRSVNLESTNSAGILLSVTSRVLTLATCDSFGAKTDRFVVTADFVESHSIAS